MNEDCEGTFSAAPPQQQPVIQQIECRARHGGQSEQQNLGVASEFGTRAWTLHRNHKNAAAFPNKTQNRNINAHGQRSAAYRDAMPGADGLS